jgi:predicted RNA binding protein YcfA (HicA-like mRNA interferase family)
LGVVPLRSCGATPKFVIVRALPLVGFFEDRQKGSHLILIHGTTKRRVVVPMHQGKTIKKSLLFAIIHDTGLTTEGFLELL